MAMYFIVAILLLFALFSLVMVCVSWNTDRRKRHARWLGLSLLAVSLAAAATYGAIWYVWIPLVGQEMKVEHDALRAKQFSETTIVKTGDRAPTFKLETLSGEVFDVPQRDRVVVVSFFATWCGSCLVELPHLQRMWESRKNDDRFRMLVISREETADEVSDFLDSKGYTFPAAADPDRFFYSKFALESIPRTFVIAPDGTIAHASIGFIKDDQHELEKIVDDLLASLSDLSSEQN